MGESSQPTRRVALRWVAAVAMAFGVGLAVGVWVGRGSVGTTATAPAEQTATLEQQLIGKWLTGAGGTLEFKVDGTFEDSFRTRVLDLKPGEVIEDPTNLRMAERDAKRVGQYRWIDKERIEVKVAGQPERRSRIVIEGQTLSILGEDGTVERLKRSR